MCDNLLAGFAATFLLPLEPRLYAMFASNGELRCQWDKNVTEQHVVEELDPGRDVCYVAFRRIATVHPRDVVTLRVKCRLPVRPKVVQAAGDLVNYHSRGSSSAASDPWSESDAETTAYSSMSCSIDHPKAPEKWVMRHSDASWASERSQTRHLLGPQEDFKRLKNAGLLCVLCMRTAPGV